MTSMILPYRQLWPPPLTHATPATRTCPQICHAALPHGPHTWHPACFSPQSSCWGWRALSFQSCLPWVSHWKQSHPTPVILIGCLILLQRVYHCRSNSIHFFPVYLIIFFLPLVYEHFLSHPSHLEHAWSRQKLKDLLNKCTNGCCPKILTSGPVMLHFLRK